MLPRAGDRSRVRAGFGLLALRCCPGGGLMFPHLRSDACKKLKMAILGQEKAGGKEDFALLRFPV